MPKKYEAESLTRFAENILVKSGIEKDRASVIARILVEGDLLGHYTHGTKLLPAYIKEIQSGRMLTDGEPDIVSDKGSAILIDGKYLPGPWLVNFALEMCYSRLVQQPTVMVVIRKSHHIACLGSYLKRITERGLIGIILSSDPNHASVAPFGSSEPCYSPNPIAAGIPTKSDPILIDMSVSSTANGVVARYLEQGRVLPHPWLLSNKGEATNDPKLFFTDPPGSILPLGGQDLGYKGFGLGILIEALTSALGGYGRADHPSQWGGAVYIHLINPEAFAGLDKLTRETTFFTDICRKAKPLPEGNGVSIPGTFELRNWEEQVSKGVYLDDAIVRGIESLAKQYDIELPLEL